MFMSAVTPALIPTGRLVPKVIAPKAIPKPVAVSVVTEAKQSWFEKTVSQPLARRSLVSGLAAIVEMAKGHQSSGLSAGHLHYQNLWEQANALIEAYATKYQIKRSVLDAQLPSMLMLERLAVVSQSKPAAAMSAAKNPFVLLGLLCIAPAVGGAVVGLFQAGMHLASHVFGG
jgi:hypothetical protein